MNKSVEMAQKLCPQCGNKVDLDARFCKHCAFALTSSQENSNDSSFFEIAESGTKNKLPLVIGGIVLVALLLTGIIALILYSKSNNPSASTNVNTTSQSTLTLSEKAQKIEEKILRGEALNLSDIEGIPPEELRILRNVHFARYGRKYDKPGLGDYFFTRPWYKLNDNYNDSMITSTDKSNINLILSVEKPSNTENINFATPSPIPSMQVNNSPAGSLTNSNVQNTVNAFMSEFTKGGNIVVDGIRELPNENAATADLKFVNWVCSTTYEGGLSKQTPPPVTKDRFGMPSSTFGLRLVTYNTRGIAVLKHYNDGRWVLTQVRVGEGFNAVNINGSRDVR